MHRRIFTKHGTAFLRRIEKKSDSYPLALPVATLFPQDNSIWVVSCRVMHFSGCSYIFSFSVEVLDDGDDDDDEGNTTLPEASSSALVHHHGKCISSGGCGGVSSIFLSRLMARTTAPAEGGRTLGGGSCSVLPPMLDDFHFDKSMRMVAG